jgi:hypothetical protein
MLTIGILCEGAQTDALVLELLLRHKFPPPQVNFIFQGVSKADIFGDPSPWINLLIKKGAERIIVVWDITPTGVGMAVPAQWSGRPNRSEQRRMLLQKMAASPTLPPKLLDQVNNLAYRYGFLEANPPAMIHEQLHLVCVCYTLEAWLISDHQVLCELASSRERKITRLDSPPAQPDHCPVPSRSLARCFRSAPNKRLRYYNKHEHNRLIAQKYIELHRVDSMRASQSFRRLVDTISGWVIQ